MDINNSGHVMRSIFIAVYIHVVACVLPGAIIMLFTNLTLFCYAHRFSYYAQCVLHAYGAMLC